jgi:hypothetical protein
MGYDDLLKRKIEQIRRKLIRDLTELCQLSRSDSARGFIGFTKKRGGVGLRAVARRCEGALYVDLQGGKQESYLALMLPRREVMRLRKLRWACTDPLHPLEALAEVEDDSSELL